VQLNLFCLPVLPCGSIIVMQDFETLKTLDYEQTL